MTSDPGEGVAADGTIVTGVARDRVPASYELVLDEVVAAVPPGAAVYLYGSVATGRATPPGSDVDLLVLDVDEREARRIGRTLSARHDRLCRGVEVAAGSTAALGDASDEAYGGRVFFRHHCVHLAGPDPAADLPRFPADVRAARGFNGDVAAHLGRWRRALAAIRGIGRARSVAPGARAGVPATTDVERVRGLARRVARKSLLAVAGLVSVHDRTWTTDRRGAAARWAVVDPASADGLRTLVGWLDAPTDDADLLAATLDGVVARVVERFAQGVGLWDGVSVAAATEEGS